MDELNSGHAHKGHERFWDDLEPTEKATLAAIKTADDITAVEYHDYWEDDHELCVGVSINGVAIGFWWIGLETAAAFVFPESEKAKQVIFDLVAEAVSEDEAQVKEDA